MLSFLLWNINRNQPREQLARLVELHQIDILILLESGFASAGDVLLALNATANPPFSIPQSNVKAIQVFTRFSRTFTKEIASEKRLSIRRISLPTRTEFLLATVHFPSKLWMKDQSQDLECSYLARYITEVEANADLDRTLLVGDLNMNPFQCGVMAAGSLNAVMTREIAQRGTRRVQGRDHPFFYSPMWGLHGDGTPGPAGTYFRDSSDHHDYFWNMFDQVLIRPNLLPHFRTGDVEILSDDGASSLLNAKGHPNAEHISDHLPLLFKLNI